MTTLTNIKAVKVGNHKIELTVNAKGLPVARHFKTLTSGKNKGQLKLVEGYYFTTVARRDEWVANCVKGLNATAAAEQAKAERTAAVAAEIKEGKHPFQVGTVVYNSWGYEQTNIDFYQVIEVKAATVVLRPISGSVVEFDHRSESGRVRPLVDKFNGEAFTKKISFYAGEKGPNFYMNMEVGSLRVYDCGEKGTYFSKGY